MNQDRSIIALIERPVLPNMRAVRSSPAKAFVEWPPSASAPAESIAPDEEPDLTSVRAARCVYHYLEELALYMYGLSASERKMGHLLLRGFVYQQIADQMFLSESTIKVEAQRIFAKAHVKDRRAFEQHLHALIESL